MSDTIYCMDTSALIHLKRLYPMDVFQGLWREVSRLVRSGRLIAPIEVSKKIEVKDDELLRWAKTHRRIFKKLNAEQVAKVREIEHAFPSLVDPEKEVPDADPFVIALAIVENESQKQGLFPGQCLVITQEAPGRSKGKIRIPDVCEHYQIERISIIDLLRKEGWKF